MGVRLMFGGRRLPGLLELSLRRRGGGRETPDGSFRHGRGRCRSCARAEGSDLAVGFSEQFGKTIRYQALDPFVFREPIIGPGTAGVVGFYQALSQAAHMVIAQDISAQRLIGLQPRTVKASLAEMLA